MSYNLSGKIAIVTGSSSGLGEAIAVHLAKWGASVTVCGRNEDRLEAVKHKCIEASGGKSGQFLAIQGDLCVTEARNRIVDETVAKFGKLDIVVANAGATDEIGQFETMTEESYDAVFNTNVKSVLFLIQRAAPHLIKTKGNVVTISSIVSDMVTPTMLHYSLTKVAVDHLSRTLSVILGAKGVRVNSIRPGVFKTKLLRSMEGTEGLYDGVKALTPLKRLGDLADIAEAVGFLISDKATFVNGASLTVDGGVSLVNPFAVGALDTQETA